MRQVRKKEGTRLAKRWLMIHVGMVALEELDRGMDIATTFEDRHGGHPPMYFARYTEDMTIRITVLTNQDNRTLKRHFRKLGVHKLRITERGGGSWEHCHMYQVAKHVKPKTPRDVQDVVHWLHNMCNYNYLQEVTNYQETSASIMLRLIKRPNEPQRSAEVAKA
ncbi:MAG: hypothetical protein ACOYB3_00635 [Azonexus sp.]